MKFIILESEENVFDNEDNFFSILRDGFHAELEHKETVNGDFIKIIEIALTHLKEDAKYYTKLKKMEADDQPKEEKPDDEEKEDEDAESEKDEDEKDEPEDDDDEDEEKESTLKTA